MEVEFKKININPQTLDEAIQVIGQLVKIIISLKKENDSLRESITKISHTSRKG